MTSKKQTNWPVPLKEKDIGLGNAVREYARATEASDHEPVAYERVLERLAERPRRTPWVVAGFAMGAAAAVITVAVLRREPAPSSHPELAQVPPAATVPVPRLLPVPQAPTFSGTTLRLAAQPTVLPTGKVTLAEEASVVLSTDAVARGHRQEGRTEIALEKGSIELHVLPRSPGHDFAVNAGDYRFVVVGTAFTVSQSETRLQLLVSEGKVAVWRGSERLDIVGAGGQWSVPLGKAEPARPRAVRAVTQPSPTVALREPLHPAVPEPARVPVIQAPTAQVDPPALAPAAPQPEPVAAPAAVRRDCGGLAARNPQEALSCFEQQAKQSGLAGESAQYEIGRLWRDAFHDPARALSAFREQRSRFPRGVLAIEADLSIVELLPRLDRHAEALSESERFLKEHPGAERRGEIHLLRGNVFREALRDFGHAEREYALGAETRGRAGDENRFLRAVCLETLGRTQEARAAYQSYLSQPKASHAQEAKKRLERLGP